MHCLYETLRSHSVIFRSLARVTTVQSVSSMLKLIQAQLQRPNRKCSSAYWKHMPFIDKSAIKSGSEMYAGETCQKMKVSVKVRLLVAVQVMGAH